jgi:hypothetical protein
MELMLDCWVGGKVGWEIQFGILGNEAPVFDEGKADRKLGFAERQSNQRQRSPVADFLNDHGFADNNLAQDNVMREARAVL